MFLVGLTGGIASGKSTVSSFMRELGVDVIDSDVIARQVVAKHSKAWKLIHKHFGAEVFLPNGDLNRSALSTIIFADESKRRLLNSITHPEIYKQIFKTCFSLFLFGAHFAVIDLPLLFESGYMTKFLHKIIVVHCGREQQTERLMTRNELSRDNAVLRINAQMSLDLKCNLADYVIDNSRDVDRTRLQVETIVNTLKLSKFYWVFRIAFLSVVIIFLIILYLCVKFIVSLFY